MNNRNMLKPAAIGGILLGVLSSIPIVSCGCCIWMIGGGILAAYLFVKESPVMVPLSKGVLLGFFVAVIGTLVYALFQIPLLLMSPEKSTELVVQMQQFLDQFPGFGPENREQIMELARSERFVSILYVSSLIGQFLGNCLLAMVGGALGVAIFEKRKIESPGTESAPQPLSDEPPSSLPPVPPAE
jgi:hypothetical protein